MERGANPSGKVMKVEWSHVLHYDGGTCGASALATYIITYDLRAPGRNYEAVYSKLKSYGIWARITESTWAVVTDQSAVQVRDALIALTDPNDRIFVIKSGVEAAWRNARCKSEWLKNRL